VLRVLTTVAFLALAAPAAAVPDCPDAHPQRTLLSGQGVLESVIGGPDGRLYFTDTDKNALMRLAAPDAQPTVVADGIDSPGGLLVGLDGKSIIVGYGDGFQQGAAGNLSGMSGLVRVDLATGKKTTIVTGTSMSNGLARDPAGVMYASSDVGTGIDRIVGDRVQRNWARVISSNGLAVSANGRYLFANQTFQPAAIQRIDLTDPSRVEQYAAPGPEDMAAGLDGLTIDQHDRLFAATNGVSGQVWRIGTDKSICALSKSVPLASAVAFGGGGAFPVTSLYAVGFQGELVEIPGARPRPVVPKHPAPYLRVHVRPRFVRAKRRTRLRITVRRGIVREPRAVVRVGRRSAVTDLRGRARVTVRPRHRGFLRLRVRAAGVPPVKLRVRVLRAKPAPRPQALTG
jgi:sugar lactone lactonase YvrE